MIVHWRKRTIFSTNGAVATRCPHPKKDGGEPTCHGIFKINGKWIINVRTKAM